MATVNTYGTTEQFVTSALMGLGATQTDPTGRFYVDGNMVNVELSNVIAEAIYIEEIFRDGQSVTGKYTANRAAGAIRVMLDTPLPSSSRTITYGGRTGTPDNGGVINVNPALLPSNDEFMIYLNQVNDQAMLFPDLSKEYIPLDVMAKKIASYARSVVQDRSASTLAEILAYNIWRSLKGAENIHTVSDLTAENAYATLLNDLNAKMDNGDIDTGAFTYSTEGRTIIGRPSFVNRMFNRNSGVILLGGDLAQTMLKEYDLDARFENKGYVGKGYKGYTLGFHIQSAPDYIWTLAEKYLGLPAGTLDDIKAIAVSFEATAVGRVIDLGVKIIDANEVRGSKAQPLNMWGHEAFRLSYIVAQASNAEAVQDALTDESLGTAAFSDDKRKHPVHPNEVGTNNEIYVPIYNAAGAVIGYKPIAAAPAPNGGNIASGVKKA